jgi:hypothetical protein
MADLSPMSSVHYVAILDMVQDPGNDIAKFFIKIILMHENKVINLIYYLLSK